ncbi:hypothetical protein B0T17DRAFT_309075 [Bombardia bombarda]|uniref:Uncharacterized protein n=1 Tax=Bombardia bombarda TaxID=252184 RepID=A0AA40C1K7_9PEZI|nr:hypothetical protein B0T17DRAFT_309075 [Bombardia bombarda]
MHGCNGTAVRSCKKFHIAINYEIVQIRNIDRLFVFSCSLPIHLPPAPLNSVPTHLPTAYPHPIHHHLS